MMRVYIYMMRIYIYIVDIDIDIDIGNKHMELWGYCMIQCGYTMG
jgi:hypothetical protein